MRPSNLVAALFEHNPRLAWSILIALVLRADYDAALGWLFAETTVIDTTHLTSGEVVTSVRDLVSESRRR